MINLTEFINFLYINFTPLLSIITIISFILNIIQFKSKQNAVHVFSSIYHLSKRTYEENEKIEKSSQEFASIMISIRHQAVAGLRVSGLNWNFDDSGLPLGGNGLIYRILAGIYHILMAIRIKLPMLIKGRDPRFAKK